MNFRNSADVDDLILLTTVEDEFPKVINNYCPGLRVTTVQYLSSRLKGIL